jgi:hypothetical protein
MICPAVAAAGVGVVLWLILARLSVDKDPNEELIEQLVAVADQGVGMEKNGYHFYWSKSDQAYVVLHFHKNTEFTEQTSIIGREAAALFVEKAKLGKPRGDKP